MQVGQSSSGLVALSPDFKPKQVILDNTKPRQDLIEEVKVALHDFPSLKKVAISEANGGTNNSLIAMGIPDLDGGDLEESDLVAVEFRFKGDQAQHDISIARDIILEVAKQAENCSRIFAELCTAGWHKGGEADTESDSHKWKNDPGFFTHINREIYDRSHDYGKDEPYNYTHSLQDRFNHAGLSFYTSTQNGPDAYMHVGSRESGVRKYNQNIQNDGTYGVMSLRDMYDIPKEKTVVDIIMGSGYNINIGTGDHIVNTENGHITRASTPALQEDWQEYGQYLEPQRIGSSEKFGDHERAEIIIAAGNIENSLSGPKLTANNVLGSIKNDLREGIQSEGTKKMLELLNISWDDAKASDLLEFQSGTVDNPNLDQSILNNSVDGEVEQQGLLALRIYQNLAMRSGTIMAKFFDDSQVAEQEDGVKVDFRNAYKIGLTGGLAKGMYSTNMPVSIRRNFVDALNQARGDNPLRVDQLVIHNPVHDGAFNIALAKLGYKVNLG